MFEEAQQRPPAKLTARIAEPRPPEVVTPRVAPPPPQPATAAPAVRPPTKAKPVPQPAPQPVTQAAPLISVEPAKQAAAPAFVAPAPPPVAQPSLPAYSARPDPQAAVQSPGIQEAGTIAQFRLELIDLAARYKRYPRVARDNNWEGNVELRIAIGEDGAISSLAVTKSSGRAVLDDEARAMFRTAKSKVAIPAALRGKAFVIDVGAKFELKDEM